jgi:hypothetical protein
MRLDIDPNGPAIGIVGAGVVGRRVAQRLSTLIPGVRITTIDTRVIDPATSPDVASLDAVLLAQPGPHHLAARRFMQRGVSVVSIGDQLDDVRALLDLDTLALHHDVSLVVGAGMSPGLVALLARHLSGHFESIDEVHMSVHGTAGPACARQLHRALAGSAINVRDGSEVIARAGTGRLIASFPEPVGEYDCYRAEVPGPLIIRRAFPQVERIQARVSANRRDRLTSRLPMLTRPHREGGIGAIRVEVRGSDEKGGRLTEIAGIAELVGTATAATAGAFLDLATDGALPSGLIVPGDESLPTSRLLHSVERLGVRLQEFTGVANV